MCDYGKRKRLIYLIIETFHAMFIRIGSHFDLFEMEEYDWFKHPRTNENVYSSILIG
jgi:hypothetical protein